MILNGNFNNTPSPSVGTETEFVGCSFMQDSPIGVVGSKRGVRLFPGDDTPRTFTECNLINAEPPPGSTLVGCNTAIIEYDVQTGTETVTIDGQAVSIPVYANLVHGRIDPTTLGYVDNPTPIENPSNGPGA